MGAYLFGFGTIVQPVFYDEFKPFLLQGYINGCFMGCIKGGKYRFTEAPQGVEDYYASCLNAYYHRKAFIDTRFYLMQEKTFKNRGGLSDFRTLESEKQATLWLRKKFGEVIRIKQGGKDKKFLSFEYQRSMNLPY